MIKFRGRALDVALVESSPSNGELSPRSAQPAASGPRATSGSNLKPVTAPPVETIFVIDGTQYPATLRNLSRRGCLLVTSYKPPIGALIRIGRITARVTDRFQDSIAVEFVDVEI